MAIYTLSHIKNILTCAIPCVPRIMCNIFWFFCEQHLQLQMDGMQLQLQLQFHLHLHLHRWMLLLLLLVFHLVGRLINLLLLPQVGSNRRPICLWQLTSASISFYLGSTLVLLSCFCLLSDYLALKQVLSAYYFSPFCSFSLMSQNHDYKFDALPHFHLYLLFHCHYGFMYLGV